MDLKSIGFSRAGSNPANIVFYFSLFIIIIIQEYYIYIIWIYDQLLFFEILCLLLIIPIYIRVILRECKILECFISKVCFCNLELFGIGIVSTLLFLFFISLSVHFDSLLDFCVDRTLLIHCDCFSLKEILICSLILIKNFSFWVRKDQ